MLPAQREIFFKYIYAFFKYICLFQIYISFLEDRFSHGSRTRSRALCHGVWHVRRQYVIGSHANGFLMKTEHSWILSWYVDRTQTVHLMKTEHLSRFVDRMQTVLLIRQSIQKTVHSWILSNVVAVQNVEACERMLGLETHCLNCLNCLNCLPECLAILSQCL